MTDLHVKYVLNKAASASTLTGRHLGRYGSGMKHIDLAYHRGPTGIVARYPRAFESDRDREVELRVELWRRKVDFFSGFRL